MTVVNADFTVNGASPTDAIAVAAGSTVTLAIKSLTGIGGVVWSVVGNDNPVRVNPTITQAGSPNGATASFVMPADIGDGLGQSYRIQCFASDGGKPPSTSSVVKLVGVSNSYGIVPFAAGEDFDRDVTYGWTKPLNRLLSKVPTVVFTPTNPVPAVAATPGLYVQGTFKSPTTTTTQLNVIGSVSSALLTMNLRVYCITAGFVGVVSGSTV